MFYVNVHCNRVSNNRNYEMISDFPQRVYNIHENNVANLRVTLRESCNDLSHGLAVSLLVSTIRRHSHSIVIDTSHLFIHCAYTQQNFPGLCRLHLSSLPVWSEHNSQSFPALQHEGEILCFDRSQTLVVVWHLYEAQKKCPCLAKATTLC